MASLIFTDDAGKKYAVSMAAVEVSAPAPEPEPTPEPAPAPAPTPTTTMASYPALLRTDPKFSANASSGSVIVPNGGTLANKTIFVDGPNASVQFGSGGTLTNCVVKSAEAVRIGGTGTFLIDGCHLEALDSDPNGHADTIQVYTPQSYVDITVRNSCIVAHEANATAGFFAAEYVWGKFRFENVVFNGGPFGLRIHRDLADKPTSVALKNVYFVGPFGYDAFLFNVWNGPIGVSQWENVREATIDANGKLVPGNLIPEPF